MLDASVAEFVGYTCSGMAGCVSLDSQSPAVTIVSGFRLCSSLVHMLVASRMHGKQHLAQLARVGRISSTYQPQTEANVHMLLHRSDRVLRSVVESRGGLVCAVWQGAHGAPREALLVCMRRHFVASSSFLTVI